MSIDPKSDNRIAYLIYRLETERCASRAIDGDIFVLLNPSFIHIGNGECIHGDRDGTCAVDAPHYTSNTDSSMTLKHPEDRYNAWDDGDGIHHIVLNRESSALPAYGSMPTLPLAITVAALVRMEQQKRGQG